MPVFKDRSVFTNIPVKEAMRRNVHRLTAEVSLAVCIRNMIKLKTNAVLVEEEDGGLPIGVISKTDLMSAYYAGLSANSPLADVMVGPPQICFPDDRLEDVLDLMHRRGIHQVYVQGADASEIAGILAYSDVVGLLYRYCHACPKSFRKSEAIEDDDSTRLTVSDVMTAPATACNHSDSIGDIIEVISVQRLGAVLVGDERQHPAGIISKTDLILAYVHGMATTATAAAIMSSPVVTTGSNALLANAIQKMLLRDLQRLFVSTADSQKIIGVLSLSDAARFRSGTCRACGASRILDGI